MRLFFRQFGTGEPVVILHGLLGCSDNWVTFGKQLGKHYSVFIPDLRNHGRSPHSNIFDFPSLEQDVAEFVEEIGLDRIILIGHSLGGKTAMYFTLHNPAQVSKLVVVDISLRRYPPGRDHQLLLEAMLAVDFSLARSRSDVDKQLQSRVSSERLRQFLLKNVYWRDPHTLDWRPDIRSIHENLLSVFEGVDVRGTYPGPALFIRGGLSDYITEEDTGLLLKTFPGAEIKTIPQASHWVHADAPAEFGNLLMDFLSR